MDDAESPPAMTEPTLPTASTTTTSTSTLPDAFSTIRRPRLRKTAVYGKTRTIKSAKATGSSSIGAQGGNGSSKVDDGELVLQETKRAKKKRSGFKVATDNFSFDEDAFARMKLSEVPVGTNPSAPSAAARALKDKSNALNLPKLDLSYKPAESEQTAKPLREGDKGKKPEYLKEPPIAPPSSPALPLGSFVFGAAAGALPAHPPVRTYSSASSLSCGIHTSTPARSSYLQSATHHRFLEMGLADLPAIEGDADISSSPGSGIELGSSNNAGRELPRSPEHRRKHEQNVGSADPPASPPPPYVTAIDRLSSAMQMALHLQGDRAALSPASSSTGAQCEGRTSGEDEGAVSEPMVRGESDALTFPIAEGAKRDKGKGKESKSRQARSGSKTIDMATELVRPGQSPFPSKKSTLAQKKAGTSGHVASSSAVPPSGLAKVHKQRKKQRSVSEDVSQIAEKQAVQSGAIRKKLRGRTVMTEEPGGSNMARTKASKGKGKQTEFKIHGAPFEPDPQASSDDIGI